MMLGIAVATASATLIVVGNAGSGESASRIVDRTLACTVRGEGEPDTVRYLDVRAASRFGDDAPSANAFPLVGFQTGANAFYGRSTGALWVNQSTCTPTRARVALATKGLRGGQAVRFGESHRCDVPARLLVRARAVFRRAVTLRPERGASPFLIATGRISSASLAVTTATGQPVAYASVNDTSGRARIFTSPARCFPT